MLAIGALIAIVVLCVKHWDEITAAVSTFASNAIAWFSELPGKIAEKASEWWTAAKTSISEFASGVYDGFLELVGKVGEWVQENLITPISDKVGDFVNTGKTVVDNIRQGIENAWNDLKTWFNGIWDSLFNKSTSFSFTASSSTSSAASGLDYVPYNGFPAILHEGEAVLTASEADAWRKGSGGAGNGVVINQYINAPTQTPVQLASATAAYFEQARWAI